MIFWYLLSFPFWFAGAALLFAIARDFKRFGTKAYTETPVFQSFAIWFGCLLLAIGAYICGIV